MRTDAIDRERLNIGLLDSTHAKIQNYVSKNVERIHGRHTRQNR